ncbi:MAG: phosphatidylglycerophosphatase A [Bacteroidaceae bacterium]|nr:phosphatidylglycerophosphatase A [Bacteroidaceae bacterium]
MTQDKIRKTDVALVTTLGAGFWPWGPGTAGAAVGVLFWWVGALLFPYSTVWWGTLAAIVLVNTFSVPAINRIERHWGEDPSRVVIDETVGVWICLLGVPATMEWYYILAAFLLFRFFDILKPFGIRKMEAFPGGWGVMLDDILSGIYGLVVLLAAQVVLLWFAN